MYWDDELDASIPTIVGVDHPLSLGYELKLVTTSPYADKSVRVTQKVMDKILAGSKGEGFHGVFFKRRRVVIAVNFSSEEPWSKCRVIELLVHEASHAVDYYFERAVIEKVDTELRAYYNDWIVGKLLHRFAKIAE